MASIERHLEQGREAYGRRQWARAHEALTNASRSATLAPPDLWCLALASYLVGRDDQFVAALEGAHLGHLKAGERHAAVRCAFWLGMHLANSGEDARASGWFGRAARLLEREEDCAERGFLVATGGHRQLIDGELEAASVSAGEAAAIGQRFGDADLLALALHLHGRILLRMGRVAEGLALLDEAMIAVSADELTPPMTGLIYCSVIGACREVYAVRRAKEWTAALNAWCRRQPDMVAYTGECRGYRAEILCMSGELRAAVEEARLASEAFARGSTPRAAGFAHYQRAEAHRLLGELDDAQAAYAAASRCGHEPQPGMALLRLAQGDRVAAASAIDRVLAETKAGLRRARLLPAAIEIALEAGELDDARRMLGELEEAAGACAGELLDAEIGKARGSIELAAGNPREALVSLREAWRAWQAADVPYEAARVRALLGRACRALGDQDGAALELEAARSELERLGAAPALSALVPEAPPRERGDGHGLTPREREVLALVATGRTNRDVAGKLFISEKTVARHVSNIFGKLGLSSRAAATAYAYDHGLLDPRT